MVQMHLLQLLALVAMEQPASFAAGDIRDEKAKVLRALRPITEDLVAHEAVRGQYGPGEVDGEAVEGYRQTEEVDRQSSVETYVALRAWIDNWRWQGVPFYLRTGKRLPRRLTEIAIGFECVPTCLFDDRSLCRRIEGNALVLRVQPRAGVHLRLTTKTPGEPMDLAGVNLDFGYEDVFGRAPPEAYETLLEDLMRGDTALFARRDQVELAWAWIDPILNVWQRERPEGFPNYAAGSNGPEAADRLLAELGHRWRA
jgi:glucose-6-phosphate 1-dehydrogenase